MKRSRRTSTSTFGAPGRVSHDATNFYNSRLYEGLPTEQESEYTENPIPAESLIRIFAHTSEGMSELPDSCVHLLVTSPPYNVGNDYDENLTLADYRDFLRRV